MDEHFSNIRLNHQFVSLSRHFIEIASKYYSWHAARDFQISINDELPIYMEDLLGLMLKKLFYNLKQFLEKINNSNI